MLGGCLGVVGLNRGLDSAESIFLSANHLNRRNTPPYLSSPRNTITMCSCGRSYFYAYTARLSATIILITCLLILTGYCIHIKDPGSGREMSLLISSLSATDYEPWCPCFLVFTSLLVYTVLSLFSTGSLTSAPPPIKMNLFISPHLQKPLLYYKMP